jgi:hypothetical protein
MNNLKAPRHRPKAKLTLDNDFLDYLYSKSPVLKYKYKKQEIKNIVREFNKKAADKIVNYRYGVEMPLFGKHLIGTSFIHDKVILDYGAYCKGEIKYFSNHETNGRLGKIVAKRLKQTTSFNSNFYGFVPHRTLARNFSKAFKENYLFYMQVDIKALVAKRLYKEEDVEEIITDTYNEFEL